MSFILADAAWTLDSNRWYGGSGAVAVGLPALVTVWAARHAEG